MSHKLKCAILPLLVVVILTACASEPAPTITYLPDNLKFSGERAYAIEEEFVTTFTYRISGSEQSRLATEWLKERFEASGLTCIFDEWETVHFSRTIPLRNVVCKLPGESSDDPREIVLASHHDIVETTIQAADDNGSGLAALLHLAEIFSAEDPPRYTLVFVATDAEEFGMVGSRRYIETHPHKENIIAGFAVDNIGMYYCNSTKLELLGQFSGYGPVWLARTAMGIANANEDLWDVHLVSPDPLSQSIDQAVPFSLLDQGPMVALGIPALGIACDFPHETREFADLDYNRWHDPIDTTDLQSPEALEGSGKVVESLIRQLLSMESFPKESGPYLYFQGSQQILRGAPLYLIFVGFVMLFFLGSFFVGGVSLQEKFKGWRQALPHYLGLFLPLVASLLLLYLFVAVGIMDEYHVYPATTKHPAMLNPRWPAVLLYILGLGIFLFIGRRLARRFAGISGPIEFGYVKSLAFFIMSLVGIYIIIANPFSLLLCVPTLFWFLIRGKRGFWKILDVIFFLLGAAFIYLMIYQFGFLVLRYGWVFLWMFMNMFSIHMFSTLAAVAGFAVLAAGLSLVVSPPRKA